MNHFPIKYFEDNLIFNTNNECWGVFRVKNFNYDFLTDDKKIEILDRLTKFISNIGIEAKILVIPVNGSCIDNLNNILENTNDEKMTPILKPYMKYLSNHLKTTRNIEYRVYVITNLSYNYTLDDSNMIKNFLKSINKKFGIDKNQISKKDIESLDIISKKYAVNQSRRLQIDKITTAEVQWLIKRVFNRGTNEKTKIFDWRPTALDGPLRRYETIIPYSKDIVTLSSGLVDLSHKRCLKIEHSNYDSWQAFLVITKIPDSLKFPGFEYLLMSQLMGFGIETCITIKNTDHKIALRKIEKKRMSVTSQISHIQNNSSSVPDDLFEALENADQLESELKNTTSPLSYISITFCISAASRDELEQRVKHVEDYYKDQRFGIERPLTDQGKMFMEFLPGTNRYIKDFDIPLPPNVLAGGIFAAATDLGDNKGMYIGKGGSQNKAVFLDLLYACQLNKPAAVYIEGAQGFGKTFNSNLMVYLHVLNGARAFIIDPKGDRKDWTSKLPELSDFISTIEFKSSKQDMGKLDPFLIHKNNMNEAGQLALNILVELFDIRTNSKEYITLIETIDIVKNSDNPCMETLYHELENFNENDDFYKNAKLLARQIKTLNKPSLAGLLYGDGSKKGLNFNNRINIIMIQELKLPSGSNLSKNDYTSEEKLGTVLMLAVANFAKNFSQKDNSIKKLIVMDEAWALIKTQQGEALFERLARTGRSLNTSCIFIGHSSKDLTTEGIRNAIRYKFVFNLGNREEAISTLEFLGMDISEKNIALLSSDEVGLKNGECIFSDVYGRIGLLKFDAVFPHLIKAFKTTPPENPKRRIG